MFKIDSGKMILGGLFISALFLAGCASDNMDSMDSMDKSMEKPMMDNSMDSKKKKPMMDSM